MTKDHEGGHGTQTPSTASKGYPSDRFDGTPRTRRVGAHRVTAQPRVVWQFVVGGLVGAALLTTAGIVGVNLADSAGKLPELPNQTQEPEAPKVKPLLDPEASVVVLDGTSPTGDLALRLAPIVSDNLWGVISFAGPAASSDVEISAVFYSDPADEAAALGLGKELGGLSSYQTSDYEEYDSRLVVLLGADYGGPGLEAG